MKKNFMIGSMDGIRDSSGDFLSGEWCVNCINMWKGTLGKNLTLENAITGHLIILLHELTHTCTEENHKDSWDHFICEHILNKNRKDIWG